MEDGGVDTTVIESRQHNMGQTADFPPLVAPSVFYFVPQFKFQTAWRALMNLVNTTLFQKYVD